MKTVAFSLVLFVLAQTMSAQKFEFQKTGDTIFFYLPLDNEDFIIIDSTAINTKTRTVICDLRGKQVVFPSGSQEHRKFYPYPNGKDSSYSNLKRYCRIAKILDSGYFKNIYVANTNPGRPDYSILLKALQSPGETFYSKAYESYSYTDWHGTKTYRYTDISFSEEEFQVASNRVEKNVFPWEAFAAMLVVISCSLVSSKRFYRDWQDKKFTAAINRNTNRIDPLPSGEYLNISIVGSFFIALSAILPSAALSEYYTIWLNLYIIVFFLFASFIIMAPIALVSRQMFRINRSFGILSIAFLSTALLFVIYGFSYWMYLPVAGALIGYYLDHTMGKKHGNILSVRLTNYGKSRKVSL